VLCKRRRCILQLFVKKRFKLLHLPQRLRSVPGPIQVRVCPAPLPVHNLRKPTRHLQSAMPHLQHLIVCRIGHPGRQVDHAPTATPPQSDRWSWHIAGLDGASCVPDGFQQLASTHSPGWDSPAARRASRSFCLSSSFSIRNLSISFFFSSSFRRWIRSCQPPRPPEQSSLSTPPRPRHLSPRNTPCNRSDAAGHTQPR
jgi:hypothetical protein